MPIELVTTLEGDEFEILRHMTEETRTFAVPLGVALPQKLQDALERLMLRDWIRLIDVSPTPTATGDLRLMRVFRVMPIAVEWYQREKRTGA